MRIKYVVIGFLIGIAAVILIGATVMNNNKMFVVDESRYEFIETIDRIEQLARDNEWTVSHMYNLQASLAKHNLEVEPVVVISLCKPDLSVKILGNDSERAASAMMPCRVSVYKTTDGKVLVSRMNVDMMSAMLTGLTKEAMVMASKETEEFLKTVLK